MVRGSTLSLGGRRFKHPGRIRPKTSKMVHAASLLDAQYLKRTECGQATISWQSLCRLDGLNCFLCLKFLAREHIIDTSGPLMPNNDFTCAFNELHSFEW